MIFGRFGQVLLGQLNKLANWFWSRDPIAQMQYEYDKAVEQLKEGRTGLEQYRGLVERVQRQVTTNDKQQRTLEAKIKAYLKAGDRTTAGQLAIELQKVKQELAENRDQLQMHETAYGNNLEKIKHASKKLADVRQKITKYQADLRMSEAEAEIARLAQTFDFNVTTDFGQLEQVVQERIDRNRGAVRVAADLSEEGVEQVHAEKAMEQALAEDLLGQFEVEMGLKTPETAGISPSAKTLGPAEAATTAAAAADPAVTTDKA